jgi:C4-dicarboxylate transporter
MIYPLLFGITYTLLLAYFLKKLNKLKSPYTFLCLLPIIAGIADYLENIGIITMLNSYPDLTEAGVNATNTFSIIKSTSSSIFFIALIIILIILGIKFVKGDKDSANIERT